ncbi:neuropeptide CCHamide-2 receptor-like [Coccinella septempunctata]|uniref:neuropeptide CCHamide-2 receptor-like n=1 Tax=Coccinella septempunctata TaxID=41139 RepID=UPI001D089A32|nr:neuropeptide CCHamide-2 receptor-like [Coccinella septempunctata]XP_044758876.1 neuropeptide CCHamide-2 receptor-like [Coccinella septempunctata]XP_044758877.1 neuropeptide CCHamide-2 receptor-like [Coccinella septempunctata]
MYLTTLPPPEYDSDIDNDYTPYNQRPETYIVPVLFFIIFVLGTLGNGTLVVIFMKHRAMRNVPNTYIFSLALADLLVILTCVPFTSTLYTVESWPWGVFLCRVSEISKNISIGVSVFTLTALSVERYCAVVNPLRRLQTKPLTVTSAVIIWILAAGLTIPDGIKSTLEDIDIGNNRTITICTPFPNATTSKTYVKYNVVMKSLIYYIFPLLIIASFYVLMAIKLHASTREMPGENKGAQGAVQARARRNVARMVLIFIFLFFICFLPNHVFMLWFHLYPNSEDEYNDWWHAIRITGFCLSFLNSCVNPVALYCVSGVFRAHFNRYLFCSNPKLLRNPQTRGTYDSSLGSTFRRQTQATMLDNSNSIIRRNPLIRRESTDCTSVMFENQSQKDKMTDEKLEELQILHNDMTHKKNVYIN